MNAPCNLLALLLGAGLASFQLVLLSTEGGINPGEERITLDQDGSVLVRSWRLSQGSPREERWAVGPAVVEAVAAAIAEAQFFEFPELLNEATGAVAAFSTTLEVGTDSGRHSVTAYRHGSPPPPQRFVQLAQRIRELVLKARPSPPPPEPTP
ncbi:MAG: hypothetical protein HXY19_02520 [Thermoanaerobaculaceae bacterium]|nr:hypothetical protein [Thermoanaerobaculaceae bacterium]